MQRKLKKAQMGGLQGFVVTIGIVIFVIAIILTLVSKLGDKMTADSFAANATSEMEEELAGISGWIGIIILAFIALIVLGIVALYKRFSG